MQRPTQHTTALTSVCASSLLAPLLSQVRELKRQVTLEELKTHKGGALSSMALFTTARLSVQPVSQAEWDFVLSLEEKEP